MKDLDAGTYVVTFRVLGPISSPSPGSSQTANGTFAARRDSPAGSSPAAVTIGNFNGTGLPNQPVTNQLAVTNQLDNTVSILFPIPARPGRTRFSGHFTVGSNPSAIAVASFTTNKYPTATGIGATSSWRTREAMTSVC